MSGRNQIRQVHLAVDDVGRLSLGPSTIAAYHLAMPSKSWEVDAGILGSNAQIVLGEIGASFPLGKLCILMPGCFQSFMTNKFLSSSLESVHWAGGMVFRVCLELDIICRMKTLGFSSDHAQSVLEIRESINTQWALSYTESVKST